MNTTSEKNSTKHPGHIIREHFMAPLKITAYRLSKELGVTPITISHVLRGKRSISTSMAARLEVFFDVPGEFWLNLQAKHDLSQKETLLDGCPVTRCEALGERCFNIQDGPDGNLEVCVVEVNASQNGQSNSKKTKSSRANSKSSIASSKAARL